MPGGVIVPSERTILLRSCRKRSRSCAVRTRQHLLIDLAGDRIGSLEHAIAFLGQAHRIGACILLGAAALQQTLLDHPADDVGERRAIDAGALDQIGLAEAFVLRNRQQHRELARRQPAVGHLALEYVARALAGSMQQMDRRALETI